MKRTYSRGIVFSIFLLLVLLRLLGVNQPIYDDETNFVQSVNDPGEYLTIKPVSIHAHPPIAGWIYLSVGKFFGQEVWIYRLIPFFFGIINLMLVYHIVKIIYSQRAAVFSLLLMGTSFYHLLMSLEIEIEGSVLVTTFLLMTYYYFRFQKTKQKKFILYTGMAFGLSLLTKISAIFFFGILVIHYFVDKEKLQQIFSLNHIKRTIFNLLPIGITGAFMFSLYPLLMLGHFQKVFSHGSAYYGLNFSLMAVAMLLFWSTPYLLAPFFLQLIELERKNSFWVVWFVSIFVIYTFLIVGRPGTHGAIGGVADYSRFFMNLVIPMSVLGGVYLSRIRFNFKEKILLVLSTVTLLAMFYYVNYHTKESLPRNFGIYLTALKNLNLNFLFPYTTSSGNLMGVSFLIIVVSLLLTFMLILLVFALKRNKNSQKTILIILFSLGVSVNLFLISEYLGPVTSPDLNQIFYEVIDFTKSHQLKQPIYTNNEGLLLHYNNLKFEKNQHQRYIGMYLEDIEQMPSKEGTFLYLNWPVQDFQDPRFKFLNNCKILQAFHSKDFIYGYIFEC
jgi:hypothetical protein